MTSFIKVWLLSNRFSCTHCLLIFHINDIKYYQFKSRYVFFQWVAVVTGQALLQVYTYSQFVHVIKIAYESGHLHRFVRMFDDLMPFTRNQWNDWLKTLIWNTFTLKHSWWHTNAQTHICRTLLCVSFKSGAEIQGDGDISTPLFDMGGWSM